MKMLRKTEGHLSVFNVDVINELIREWIAQAEGKGATLLEIQQAAKSINVACEQMFKDAYCELSTQHNKARAKELIEQINENLKVYGSETPTK